MKATACSILLISLVSAAISYPDSYTNLHRRDQANLVLPANGGQLSRHDSAAVNGLLQLSAQPKLPVTIPSSTLHMLPEVIMIDHLLPHLSFKEAMNLADKRLTEQDIITHCDKSNAQEIIAYIFRDLGSSDHGITDEVRLKNFRILLNSEQVQRKIENENIAAVHHTQNMIINRTDPNVSSDLVPHPFLDSLQVAVNGTAKNGKTDLLRELLVNYPTQFSQLTIPHEAIYVAAARGDSIMVGLILERAKGKLPLRIWSDMSHFDESIYYGLKGSIATGQFGMFSEIVNLSNPSGRTIIRFPPFIARELLNNNLRHWLDHAIINGKYIIDREKAIYFYVKRSNLKDGNAFKPSLENVKYLMLLPDYYRVSMKSFISTMRDADFDIVEDLARLFLDPDLTFEAQVYIQTGRKRRLQDKLVFGMEALNHAIDMVNEYKSKRYNHVKVALEKVKGEFDSLQK
jgi:hypothetical protein